MARDTLPGRMRVLQGPLFPRVESGGVLAPDQVAARITNMVATSENSLKSVIGPAPYLPWIGIPRVETDGDTAGSDAAAVGLSKVHNYFEDYNDTHGIFHAVINNGTREVLLLHSGEEIWTFEGWERGWRVLLGPGKFNLGSSTQPDTVR